MKKLTIDKQEEIKLEIDNVQARAKTRTISYEDIVDTLKEIDARLGISNAAKKGVKVFVDYHAPHFPARYNGRPESTQFRAEHNGKTWAITEICRGYTIHTENKAINLTFTDTAKAAIIKNLESMSL